MGQGRAVWNLYYPPTSHFLKLLASTYSLIRLDIVWCSLLLSLQNENALLSWTAFGTPWLEATTAITLPLRLCLSLSPSLSPISWDYTSVNSSKTNFYTFPRICAFLDNIRTLKSFLHYLFIMEKLLKEYSGLKICGIMLLITTEKKTRPTEQIIKCIDRNQRTTLQVYGSVVVENRTFL